MEVEFLSVEDVVAIHQLQIERFGGSPGLRDLGLLESAVAQAEASFGGRFVHANPPEMGEVPYGTSRQSR